MKEWPFCPPGICITPAGGALGSFQSAGAGWMLTWLGSVLSKALGSKRFRVADGVEAVGEWNALLVGEDLEAFPLGFEPHPHLRARGMAAVTLPHEHACSGGWGQTLSGRPGFRTETINRSSAWLHFVERWPRMHGSLRGDTRLAAGRLQNGRTKLHERARDIKTT